MNIMCIKLVCWRKHVCNTVIPPSHWGYIMLRQVTAGASGVAETETPFTLLQDTVPSKWLGSHLKHNMVLMPMSRGAKTGSLLFALVLFDKTCLATKQAILYLCFSKSQSWTCVCRCTKITLPASLTHSAQYWTMTKTTLCTHTVQIGALHLKGTMCKHFHFKNSSQSGLLTAHLTELRAATIHS